MDRRSIRIVIFGTGQYYEKYKRYFWPEQIAYLLDNNPSLHHTIKDNIRILPLHEADFSNIDFVVVMLSKGKREVIDQLIKIGVEGKKIRSFDNMGDIVCRELMISNKSNMTIDEWLNQYEKNGRIMIVSYDLSRTGVPIALLGLSNLLLKMKYSVLYASLESGPLEEELNENSIDHILCIKQNIESHMTQYISRFDCIILGTAALFEVAPLFFRFKTPIIWWMHESQDMYYENMRIPGDYKSIHFYGAGNRVISAFHRFYPSIEMDRFLYYLSESSKQKKIYSSKEIVFAVIGSINRRKGQDIAISAWKRLDKKTKKEARLIFVGTGSGDYLKQLNDEIIEDEFIEYRGELDSAEIHRLYLEEIDVLVAPSRDDPMPIVVSEAMQNRIPCIISTEVGQEEYMRGGYGGLIIGNEDVEGLKKGYEFFIHNRNMISKMGEQAREIYEMHFTEDIARDAFERIMEEAIM